ncbi:hypothetical protein [Helicobacter cinaedi]|uniref:hypothetical protein n=1 Tax=Helicobacter cinaedi TaxID=213 RepID=UPI001E419D64|nr:hypothetical protein [Helicobacter cinaedi]
MEETLGIFSTCERSVSNHFFEDSSNPRKAKGTYFEFAKCLWASIKALLSLSGNKSSTS